MSARHARIERVDRRVAPALSVAQESLWFLDQLNPAAATAYHLPLGFRLDGALDVRVLRLALDAIICRHESLRTTIDVRDGRPVQRIARADAGVSLREHELCGFSEAAQLAQVADLSRQEAMAAFDLANGPLVRGQLLRLGEQHHVLLITMHHIVSDDWSIGVVMTEISTLYAAFSRGAANPLTPLAIQFADYAVWQRQWLRADVLQTQATFWKQHLAGAPALLELPTDHSRPVAPDYVGCRVALAFSSELTAGLRRLGQRRGVTLAMTLLAGWSVLLSRLSGQQDLVIGTLVANRPRKELEHLAGLFVNTLALRLRLEEDPTVAELLEQIEAVTSRAYAHQDIPFAQVVEAVQPVRSLSYNPLFQAMLTFDDMPGARAPSFPGVTVTPLESTQGGAPFDVLLNLRDTGERIEGALEYARDLFERPGIERMADQLRMVLEAMVADDRQRVGSLPLLPAAGRRELLVEFNATQSAFPGGQCIHELFEAQVRRTPDATALLCAQRSLNYDELNRRANQLAHHLIALGIRPDDRVAICVERSLEMVVGLLGILKAGAAYLPLDPYYPAERLIHMLEDCQPRALVTQAALLGRPPAGAVPAVLLDPADAVSPLQREAQSNPSAAALGLTLGHLAYVIYTSGSSGRPKGVMVEHGNLANLLHSMARSPGLGADDVLLAVTTLAFDIAGLELYLPLICGARVVLVERETVLDVDGLIGLLERHAVTIMQATPALWRAVLDRGWPGSATLRVLCGGEALQRDLATRLVSKTAAVWNLYGPTETTIWSTAARVTADHPTAIERIGRPIANTSIYILDAAGQPVPIGVTGEIFIGGAGVARGYLNLTALTAERFLADPFGAARSRMYKTGDLGRWSAQGEIEYLGRNDFQVKVRGFRIELGEIEAQLMRHPQIREAAVLALDDGSGNKRLIAYYVAAGEELAQLRSYLLTSLPDYMVPAVFVRLDGLPLTANGKLNRQALPATDHAAVASTGYATPLGTVETAITQIWQTLLGVERVGRLDNFFELGGHSLLIVQFVNLLRKQLARPIGISWIYSAPSAAEFAALLTNTPQAAVSHKHLVRLNDGGFRTPLYCLCLVEGDTGAYLHLARFLDPSIPVYGLDVGYTGEEDLVNGSLDTLTDSYVQDIRSIQPQGPYRICGYSFAGAQAFELAKKFEDAGEEVTLILLDAYRFSRLWWVLEWISHSINRVRRREVIGVLKLKLRKLFLIENHRWLTGKDKDLTHALLRRAMNRKPMRFSGRVVLFKSTVIDEHSFRFQLDGRNGWSGYATGVFEVIHLQTPHLELLKEPAVHSIVKHLDQILCH